MPRRRAVYTRGGPRSNKRRGVTLAANVTMRRQRWGRRHRQKPCSHPHPCRTLKSPFSGAPRSLSVSAILLFLLLVSSFPFSSLLLSSLLLQPCISRFLVYTSDLTRARARPYIAQCRALSTADLNCEYFCLIYEPLSVARAWHSRGYY